LKKNEALLVIDVDRGDGWADNIEELDEERKLVAIRITKTLEAWRKAGGMVVFVVLIDVNRKQETTAQLVEDKPLKCLVCHLLPEKDQLAKFLGHRHGKNYEPVFVKTQNDAFTNSELISFLRSKGITKVFLAGCHTFVCVFETAIGALKNGINVALLKNCVYRQPDQKQEEVWFSEVTNSTTYSFGRSVSIE